MTTTYTYASGDLLKNRNSYTYTPFEGPALLDAWEASRAAALKDLPPESKPPDETSSTASGPPYPLDALLARIDEGETDLLDLLVRHFEVTKRIYGSYTQQVRPVDRHDYREPARYVRFAETLDRTHQRSGSLVYLNSLLKVLDTLVAHRAELGTAEQARLARLLRLERDHVRAVRRRLQESG